MIAIQLTLLVLVIGLTAYVSYRLRKPAQQSSSTASETPSPTSTRLGNRNNWAMIIGILGLSVGCVAIFLSMQRTRPSQLDLGIVKESPKFWMNQLDDLEGALEEERLRNDQLQEQFGSDPVMSRAIKQANDELDSLKQLSRNFADRLMAIHTLDPQSGARDSLLNEVANFLSSRITPLRGAFSPRLAQEYNAQAALVGRLQRDTSHLRGIIAQRDARINGLTSSLQNTLAQLNTAQQGEASALAASMATRDTLTGVRKDMAYALDTSAQRMAKLNQMNQELASKPLAMRCAFINDLLKDARAIKDPWLKKLNKNKLKFIRLLRENLSELQKGETCSYTMEQLELEFPDYYEDITLH